MEDKDKLETIYDRILALSENRIIKVGNSEYTHLEQARKYAVLMKDNQYIAAMDNLLKTPEARLVKENPGMTMYAAAEALRKKKALSRLRKGTGSRGELIVKAELERRRFVVTLTKPGTKIIDMYVTGNQSFTVQVKANAKPYSFWWLGKRGVAHVDDSHIYVFTNPTSPREYFVVPSSVVKAKVIYKKYPRMEEYKVNKKDIEDYKDRWELFGSPGYAKPETEH